MFEMRHIESFFTILPIKSQKREKWIYHSRPSKNNEFSICLLSHNSTKRLKKADNSTKEEDCNRWHCHPFYLLTKAIHKVLYTNRDTSRPQSCRHQFLYAIRIFYVTRNPAEKGLILASKKANKHIYKEATNVIFSRFIQYPC